MLIGLVGKKGSGKDTAADFLVNKYQFEKKAFADPLKLVVQHLFLLEKDDLHDPVKKEKVDSRWGLSPRQMMQMVGTDMVRTSLGEDFWLKHMGFSFASSSSRHLVVSDVRFENEAQWVRHNLGVLIRIHSKEITPPLDTHVSENEMEQIEVDLVLYNNKSEGKETFYNQIDNLLQILQV